MPEPSTSQFALVAGLSNVVTAALTVIEDEP
jgi:hypothetical protein